MAEDSHQLTHLSFACQEQRGAYATILSEDSLRRSSRPSKLYEEICRLGQLSVLVNLEHLELSSLPSAGLPDGVPSQLVKLTRLYLCYTINHHAAAACSEQIGQLSSLTSL
jgi:hypothetical protein